MHCDVWTAESSPQRLPRIDHQKVVEVSADELNYDGIEVLAECDRRGYHANTGAGEESRVTRLPNSCSHRVSQLKATRNVKVASGRQRGWIKRL
jgi:hypothetical protein